MEQNNKPWLDGVNEWMKKLVPNGDLLFESEVDETSRRQKAQQAIVGQNHRVKTMAIISPENPMGMKAPKEYNNKSMEEMINSLKIGHFKWFKVKGLYNDPENSLIIYLVHSLEHNLIPWDMINEQISFQLQLPYMGVRVGTLLLRIALILAITVIIVKIKEQVQGNAREK